tara:strand:+ start:396 stop:1367 length:972 start_codon:yes stop_codon:yes gene_type:complete
MSLFDYYRDALNLLDEDSGLAALATGAETAYRSAGNPYESNTALGGVNVNEEREIESIGVPNYTYERAQVPGTYEANRRPGSRGQRYFSDAGFVPQGNPQRQAVQNTYANQASDAQLVNRANAAQQRQFDAQPRPTYTQPTATPMNFAPYAPPVNPVSEAGTSNPAPTRNDLMAFLAQKEKKKREGGSSGNLPEGAMGGPHPQPNMRAGGLARLAGGGAASAYNRRYNGYAMGGIPQTQGYYLGGTTDGMADTIPARIDNNQEARLSDGEFVVPADVVSHLGNGNSSAGAKNLYGMMDRVRTARTGNKQQGRQIDPNKFIPNR